MKKIARRKAKKVKVSEKTAAYWTYVMQRKDFGGCRRTDSTWKKMERLAA
ncbi:hypothetical protein MKQ70_13115 [Chitinophaga sedimenti]|nr:hypothetical protein [Chitinophaga sedimenti]MCK7555907.1 hypothetical protein [Chitinophaga sedimenti]